MKSRKFVGIMDALVHLSLREGLPRALPQALAAGKPVVAYDCDGAREVCFDGKTGFLVQPRDLTALKNRLLQLADDSPLGKQFGQAGRQFVRENFAVEKMVDAIYNLYQKLAAERWPPAVNFPFNFFAAAFASAFLTTLMALPLCRDWCLRTNHVDDPGERKIHDAPVPLAGGLAVLTGLLLPLVLGAAFLKLGIVNISSAHLMTHGVERRGLELIAIAAGAMAITVLGWLDDRHELKPMQKFIGQFLVALLVAVACKRITLFVPKAFISATPSPFSGCSPSSTPSTSWTT